MRSMGFASEPDLVEQKCTGQVAGPVQMVGEAAWFFARRIDKGAELSLEQSSLTFACTQEDNQSYRILGQLRAACAPCAAPAWLPARAFLSRTFGHRGGDCTLARKNRKNAPRARSWIRTSYHGTFAVSAATDQ